MSRGRAMALNVPCTYKPLPVCVESSSIYQQRLVTTWASKNRRKSKKRTDEEDTFLDTKIILHAPVYCPSAKTYSRVFLGAGKFLNGEHDQSKDR